MTQNTAKLPLLIANEFHRETISRLDALFDTHKLWIHNAKEQMELVNSLKSSCKAVATASWATSPLIYELPHLEIISCFGVGVDGIDFGITRNRCVKVTNTPDVLNDAVADIAMALILATQRNLINAEKYVRQGNWQHGPFPLGTSLAGKRLGILGLGSIGEDIARRAVTFKLQVAYHNRKPKKVPYTYYDSAEALAKSSDILLCMLPGGSDTENIINQDILRALGPEGIFINVGRGTSVDEDALAYALKTGEIRAAGLDVYRNEPVVHTELIELENVVLLPHIGSATRETRRAMGELVIENLLAWTNNRELPTPVS